jgi:hypothetical protein
MSRHVPQNQMLRHLSGLGLLLLFSATIFGQPGSGVVRGVVTDESGALVPGAKVTVANASGPVKSVTAAGDGNYSVTGIPPGKYLVQASSPGLVQAQPAAVDVSGGLQPVSLNLQLRVAAEKQEVTVQENPGPTISVDPSQNAGALILRGADLDALSDDPDDLQADLQALAGPAAGPSGGQIYIDGFTGGTLPAKDSIREIRINQNPFSPEFDKLGYGRIEILTKPGSDKFHGNVNFNFGDDVFNSRNPYAQAKAPFLQREFGGTLSGPISKKASFFLDVFDRDIQNGNIINAFTLNPTTLAENPFNTVFVAPQNRLRVSPRVDYQLSKNNTLTVRYGFTRNDIQDQGVGNLSLTQRAVHQLNTDHTLQIVETAVLSTKVINETRFQLYHTDSNQLANFDLPTINVQGSFNGGGSQIGHSIDTENHYELQNYTTIAGGVHSWKFGIRVRAVTIDNISPTNFDGTFSFFGGYAPILDANFQPVAPGIVCDPSNPNPAGCETITSLDRYQRTLVFQQMGLAASAMQLLGGGASQFSVSAGNPLTNVNQVDIGTYVGDDWRVKPNFTLSLGLRYETQTNIHDYRDWAPRIGFAWAPGQSKNNPRPKLVLRGGFGIFYDRFGEQNVETADRYNGITQQSYIVTNPDFYSTSSSNLPPISQLGQFLTSQKTYEIASNLRAPYIMQSAITVERQLPRNTTVSISYLNSHGLHELRSADINAPLQGTYTGPGTGVYPYGNVGPILLMESSGLFNQNMMITNVRSQINSKISLNGFYMLGRSYSNTDGVNTVPSSPYSMAGEYGPSALDIRNRGLIAGSITTKWDLRLAPFITMNSGAPFDIISGTDPYGTTLFYARPGIATSPGPGVISTPYGLLDPNPKPGEAILPRDFGRSPGQIMVNLRLAKTFGFGPAREGSINRGGGGGGRGSGGGGPRGGPGGMRGVGGLGGGPGGFGGGGATNRRYNLTLSVQARNLLNHVNPGAINGTLTSPLFGQSNTLAGGFGAFAESGNNRRLELQMRFTF